MVGGPGGAEGRGLPADILAEQSDLVSRIRALISPLQDGAVS